MKRALQLALFMSLAIYSWGQCTITPGTAVGVRTGATLQFSASCGTGVTWSVTGSGTINSGTGLYTAPASGVTAKNQSLGCQLLPNNAPQNIPVSGLSVDSHSTRWMSRIAENFPQLSNYHNLQPQMAGPDFWNTVVNNSSTTQIARCAETQSCNGYNGVALPIPAEQFWYMQGGRLTDGASADDRHSISTNSNTCAFTEYYNVYIDFQTVSITPGNPTQISWTTDAQWTMPANYQVFFSCVSGNWSALCNNGGATSFRITPTGAHSGTIPVNSTTFGTPPACGSSGLCMGSTLSSLADCSPPGSCNTYAAQQFAWNSYAQLGGTDAGGLPIAALSVGTQELLAAANAGRTDLGHAIRFSIANNYLSDRSVWPSTTAEGFAGGVYLPILTCTPGNPTQCEVNNAYGNLASSLPGDEYSYTDAVAAITLNSGGTGHYAGDTCNIGSNTYPANAYVTSVSGGVITGITLNNRGTGYSVGTYNLTACNSGSNTGSVNVTSVTAVPTFAVNIAGFTTGSWPALNGDQTATPIDNYDFTVPVDSTGFGSFPANQGSVIPDFVPYGSTFRLMSSFTNSSVCGTTGQHDYTAVCNVYLNTLKNYGAILADASFPSEGWSTDTLFTDYRDDSIRDLSTAIYNAAALQPIETYMQVVNRSSQIGPQGGNYSDLAMFMQSNVNRTYVTATGSGGTASVDVLLSGTTIGTDHDRLGIAGGTGYQLNIWVNGNVNETPTLGTNYAISSGITGATVSSTGFLQMPSCSTQQRATVTVTSAIDTAALPLYIDVYCIPISSDGALRLAFGTPTATYTDSTGFTWWGAWNTTGPYSGWGSWYQVPGEAPQGEIYSTWQGSPPSGPCSGDTWSGTDPQLYANTMSSSGGASAGADLGVSLVVPNGTYTATLYGSAGFGGQGAGNTCANSAGQNLFDVEAQGVTVASYQDGYVLAGNNPYAGWTQIYTVSVSNNHLTLALRNRNQASIYGVQSASLKLTSAGGLTITTTSPLPAATANSPYSYTLVAVGGFTPYSWCVIEIGGACDNGSGGALPSGLTINATTGVISGTPASNTGGSPYVFQAKVTDNVGSYTTKGLALPVISATGGPGVRCTRNCSMTGNVVLK